MEPSPYIPPVHIHQKYLHHHDRCWLDIIFQPGGNFQKNKWPFRIVRIKKKLRLYEEKLVRSRYYLAVRCLRNCDAHARDKFLFAFTSTLKTIYWNLEPLILNPMTGGCSAHYRRLQYSNRGDGNSL